MKINSVAQLSILVFISAINFAAWSCPESLKLYQTKYAHGLSLCELHDRYQQALQSLLQQNIQNPERIGNLRAPRFINLPDWLSNRTNRATSALTIYEPAPSTWLSWEKGAQVIDSEARKNFDQQKIPILTMDFLKDLHATALNGLLDSAGQFRQGGEIGMALNLKSSLTRTQLVGLKNNEYRGVLNRDTKIVGFNPTHCLEHRTEEFKTEWSKQRSFKRVLWPMIDNQRYFVDAKGIERQCGYFTYAPLDEVKPQIESWLAYVNAATATWGSQQPDGDPILVAARAQRWFVSIHPYEKGNGRVSRFVMEWLLQSLGLPAPVLEDMNEDLYMTEKQWAAEVGEGILRAVSAVEECAQNPATLGCAEIAKSLEGEKP